MRQQSDSFFCEHDDSGWVWVYEWFEERSPCGGGKMRQEHADFAEYVENSES